MVLRHSCCLTVSSDPTSLYYVLGCVCAGGGAVHICGAVDSYHRSPTAEGSDCGVHMGGSRQDGLGAAQRVGRGTKVLRLGLLAADSAMRITSHAERGLVCHAVVALHVSHLSLQALVCLYRSLVPVCLPTGHPAVAVELWPRL